jgi:hypothetical protein
MRSGGGGAWWWGGRTGERTGGNRGGIVTLTLGGSPFPHLDGLFCIWANKGINCFHEECHPLVDNALMHLI